MEFTDGRSATLFCQLFGSAIEQGTRWANRSAHRLQTYRRPVVAHVALHHLVDFHRILRNSERAGKDTVGTSDAPGFERALHNSIWGLLDRIRGAHRGTGGNVAMHTNHRSSLHRVGSLNLLQVNHRDAGVSIAFGARLDAGITADASTWINIELPLAHIYDYQDRKRS